MVRHSIWACVLHFWICTIDVDGLSIDPFFVARRQGQRWRCVTKLSFMFVIDFAVAHGLDVCCGDSPGYVWSLIMKFAEDAGQRNR